MSRKINTASIGLFIVTGVALGVIGLLLFSSSKMFSKTRDLIVYFDDSLNGLNEGAPVKFRGVTVGSVKQVMVQFNQATNDYAMPVILELEEKFLRQRMPRLAYVFSEDAMAELLTQLRSTVGDLKMAEINAGVTNLLTSVNRLVTDPDITNALADLRPTLDQYRELGAAVTRRVDPLVESVTNTLAEANRTLVQFRDAGENLKSMLAPDAPIRNDLDLALQQPSGTLQSLSDVLEFLKQHPNALLTGRETVREKLKKTP